MNNNQVNNGYSLQELQERRERYIARLTNSIFNKPKTQGGNTQTLLNVSPAMIKARQSLAFQTSQNLVNADEDEMTRAAFTRQIKPAPLRVHKLIYGNG